MANFDLSSMRSDKQAAFRQLLEVARTFYRETRQLPEVADLVELTNASESSVKDHLRELADKLDIKGARRTPSALLRYFDICGDVQIADDGVPRFVITPELRDGLDELSALEALVEGARAIVGTAAARHENQTLSRIDGLVRSLRELRPFSGPRFKRAQEVLRLDLPGTHYRAGGEHPFWRDLNFRRGVLGQLAPHPDNRAGLVAVLGDEFLRNAAVYDPAKLWTDLSGNIIAVGGAPSEVLSRIHLGYQGAHEDRFRRREDLVPLPFATVYHEQDALVGASAVAGRWIFDTATGERVWSQRPNWPISMAGSSEQLRSVVVDGTEQTDHLMVVRMRNCFSLEPNSYFTSIAGPHGPGTKAIKLLMGDETDRHHRQILKDIDRELQGAEEFAILFRVPEISHTSTGSEPMRLELHAISRLSITDAQYAAHHEWIRNQLRAMVEPGHADLKGASR